MKQIGECLLFLLLSFSGKSQYVGLNKTEVTALQHLIKVDKNVTGLYASIRKIADISIIELPNPIDTLVSEGHLATDPKKIVTVKSLVDIDKIYALGITYSVEGNRIYLQKAIEFILAWAMVNKPLGNPINDTKFEKLLMAYDMIKTDFSPSQKQLVDIWLTKMADEEINTAKNKERKTSFNNWNTHRLKMIGCIAYILNNAAYKKYIEIELPIQIEKNLLPDGSGIDFVERDALHYHVYTLEPFISLATVVYKATQKDYYHFVSPSGASIKKSIDFLIPFVTGEKTHAEFVNSHVTFDKKRAENKEPGYQIGGSFHTNEAVPVLLQAAWFEAACMEAVFIIRGDKNDIPGWQAVLNKLKK